jgi:hypothetical protein
MLKFYTNKELSQIFSINLAKWKRWSREFLPPDPLGGLQSGYARQYNLDEVFTVFLGGHLVANLKFTIPQSRHILQDLYQWLVDHQFYFDFSGHAQPNCEAVPPAQDYQIAIFSTHIPDSNDSGLRYRVKATIYADTVTIHGVQMQREHFKETSINARKNESEQPQVESYRVLNISVLRQSFMNYFKFI